MVKIYKITADDLRTNGWSSASQKMLDDLVDEWPKVAAFYGFNTILRTAHFWGQVTEESAGGKELRENLSYSWKRILQVFGGGSAKVTEAEARALEHNPYALGERVYGLGNPHMAKNLGNVQAGDGYNYRGAGLLNTTGREPLSRIGLKIGKPLATSPDLANDVRVALWIGAQDFVDLGCMKFADADDAEKESIRINGGSNGMKERINLIAAWKTTLAKRQMAEIENPTTSPAPLSKTATEPAIVSQSPIVTPKNAGSSPIDLLAIGAGISTVVGLPASARAASPLEIVGIVLVAIVAIAVIWASIRLKPKESIQ